MCSVERLIFNRTPSSGLLPIFLPWIFLGGILGHGKLFELFLSPGLDLTNHFCTVCPPPTFRSWLRHGAWRMFYLRSRPCHPIFVKLSSYIDRAARSACRNSLFEVLLDKLVPLTVENDCQAFDFHYGAKKGQRCEVGVKAFSVHKCVFKD